MRSRVVSVTVLVAMAILLLAALTSAQSAPARSRATRAKAAPVSFNGKTTPSRTRTTGKATPAKTAPGKSPVPRVPLRGPRGEARAGGATGRIGAVPTKKYVAVKANQRPSLADPEYQNAIKAIATAEKQCRPRDSKTYEVGACLDNNRKNVCGNHHGISAVAATGCDRDELCCAVSKNRPRYQPHVTEIDPVCFPRDPTSQKGKCVAAAAQCRANGFHVEAAASGCPRGKAVCCVSNVKKIVAAKASSHAAPKCNTPPVSQMSDLHFDFSWKINPPYVAWTETEMVKKAGIPIGVKIFFTVKLIITVKSDVLCVSCGKQQKYNDVGIALEKVIKLPFKITGVRFITSALGSVIPGLNVAIIAVQLVEAYETFMTIKHNVHALMSAFKGARDTFKCQSGTLEASHGGKPTHGHGPSTVVVIDLDLFMKKHHKRSLSDVSEISAEDLAAAIAESVDINSADNVIALPDERINESLGEIDIDDFAFVQAQN